MQSTGTVIVSPLLSATKARRLPGSIERAFGVRKVLLPLLLLSLLLLLLLPLLLSLLSLLLPLLLLSLLRLLLLLPLLLSLLLSLLRGVRSHPVGVRDANQIGHPPAAGPTATGTGDEDSSRSDDDPLRTGRVRAASEEEYDPRRPPGRNVAFRVRFLRGRPRLPWENPKASFKQHSNQIQMGKKETFKKELFKTNKIVGGPTKQNDLRVNPKKG
jgi:hypothetical protein